MNNTSVNKNQHPYFQDKIAWFPIVLNREGDEHNSRRIAIRWLCFIVCDSMAPQFKIEAGVEFSNARIALFLPYISFYMTFNFGRRLDMFAYKYLWRVGSRSRYKWQR